MFLKICTFGLPQETYHDCWLSLFPHRIHSFTDSSLSAVQCSGLWRTGDDHWLSSCCCYFFGEKIVCSTLCTLYLYAWINNAFPWALYWTLGFYCNIILTNATRGTTPVSKQICTYTKVKLSLTHRVHSHCLCIGLQLCEASCAILWDSYCVTVLDKRRSHKMCCGRNRGVRHFWNLVRLVWNHWNQALKSLKSRGKMKSEITYFDVQFRKIPLTFRKI